MQALFTQTRSFVKNVSVVCGEQEAKWTPVAFKI